MDAAHAQTLQEKFAANLSSTFPAGFGTYRCNLFETISGSILTLADKHFEFAIASLFPQKKLLGLSFVKSLMAKFVN